MRLQKANCTEGLVVTRAIGHRVRRLKRCQKIAQMANFFASAEAPVRSKT